MKTWLTEKINKPVLSHIRILSMERHDIDGAVVRRLFVFLKGNLIFDHLLDELIQRDILNKRDIDDYICNGNCKCFKIERLIKRIIWKKRCSDFVKMIKEMPRLENIAEKIRDTQENTLWTVEDEMQGNHVLTTNDEMLQKHFGFLYMKLEPREVAHLLFQSGYISVDEHDEVIERNRKIGRLKSLLAILKKDKLYTQFVCTLQSLECNSVLETLQRNEQLESHIGEYELYIQHNFILLQTELPDPDLAKVMMEHELDKSNISDIESCGGKTRQISKLLKILLMKGTPSCKELLRVIKFHLKGEKLIQRLKDISTDKKKRGKPDLCPKRRSLNISWLQENEEVIIQELDPLYVCDLLFEDRAIEILEHDTITELKFRKEQFRNLLKTVKENKNDCFHFFLYILQNVYNSIGKKDEKSVQAAITTGSNENFECSASHRLRKLPGKPDDVQNELIEVKLTADHGSQGEQVLQNIHHSTGISEESISCGQMYVEKVSKGSVVLQLRPVTDQAVKTLLNARENNRLVEMITGMLQKADIAKIMDGTMPFEITVQVKYAKPENAKSVKEISRTALIKHRMKANKNVLVYELESTALVSVLRDSKAFDKLAIECVDKVTDNDERVEKLLSLVENGNSDVVEEFLSALKDLNYCHIVELIDPADIHTKAELIREKITSNYKNILEEMQFTFAREVLSRCIGDVDGMGKKILPKNGNRRERMSTFLQFILQEDYNVIEFENILKNNGLGDLLKVGETIQRKHTPAQDIEVTVVKDHIPSSLEDVLFESVITLSYSNIDKANKQSLGEVSGNTSVGDQKKDTKRSQSSIDIQETHLQGSLSEHKMTTLSSDSQIDCALLEVQKGFLFMLKHIHEELQLVDYLYHLCESPLSDDAKNDIRDGKGDYMIRVLLKCLISKGESACKEFLEKFKCYQNLYSKFRNAVNSVTNADSFQQDVFLTHDKLPHFEAVLFEEMDPFQVADILYCHAVLSFDELDEIDKMRYKREKAMKIFTKIRQQPDKISVFCHALEQSKSNRAIEYIKNSTSSSLSYSSAISAVKIVRFNFRKTLEYLRCCETKKKLLDYLESNKFKVTSTGKLAPKESYIIKTALRNGKPWCDCILECIKQTDIIFLKELVGRLEERRKYGREGVPVDLQFDIKMMKDMKYFLLHELEPAPVSHVLLEEEAISVDDHDEVENSIGMRKKNNALCDILIRDGSESTMKSFLYAVRKYSYIIKEIRRRQPGQQPRPRKMDWESSYCDMERQTDVPKPKQYAPNKILDPKPRPVRQSQVAVPKTIYGRSGEEGSKENEEEWPVVVALDFGTTYSGYAFWRKENPSEITTGKWNTGSKEVLESLKTPTSLLLNQNNEVIEFGYKAEKIFKELAEDEDDKGYRYFRQFKMMLHNESLLDEKKSISDHLKRPIEALEVFSLSIRDLKDECFRDFDNKRIKVDPDEILWILTVPAIWGDSAKQFMRKAAEKAGIPSDQLKLALEPEAAAIYVMKEAKTVFGKGTVTTFNPGTKIMVADLGGGTADLTVLEVKEDRKMKQLHQSAGGAWGGNLINKKIWEIMEEIFGSDVIEDFKKQTSDFMEMESIIELKKRDITIGSKLELPIFPSLSGLCKQDYRTLIKNSKHGNSVKARTGKLRFEPDMVQKIFDLTFTNLFTVVKKVLKHENAVGVKDIILVGGFAQADIIVKQFEEKFSGYKVIVPIDPVLAVLKGAVMFGQDIDIISSRITAHTYGFDAMRHFRDGDLRSKKRKIDNTIYCVDLFEKMVAIGESVDVGKTFEKEVFASSKEMKSMVLKFYQSEIKNPTYVTDPGCECIGKLSVEMPDLSGGTERSVMVSIKFGETEITVCGVDKTTGKKQETVLDLLRDTK